MLKKVLQDYASSVLRPFTDDELDELVPFKVKETSVSKAKASLKSFKDGRSPRRRYGARVVKRCLPSWRWPSCSGPRGRRFTIGENGRVPE